ncbi:MAG: FHA domain-containing protein [Myxococcota bacterium]
MAGSPRVQLSLKGRLLSEVAFVGPQLRIGRMRENDVVVNNLAVSRFHATLRREGDGFELEDLGSENGTQLNGERIQGVVPMAVNDVVQLGKYELRIVVQAGPKLASGPKARPSDAWDASQTFLALDAQPAVAKPASAPPKVAPPAAPATRAPSAPAPASEESEPFELTPEELTPEELAAEAPAANSAPDPDGVFAFGEDDLAPAEQDAVLGTVASGGGATPNPEHTSLFDFGAPAAAEGSARAAAPAAAADAASDAKLYAGLIVQRDGKLHLLRPWEDGELCAGRAPECEIMLSDAGVSRRHALFSQSPAGYEVRDLESVNGIYVNGQRTKKHVLAVGDVVRIESFELTFVLDHQPIGSEVNGPAPTPGLPQERGRATQFSLEAAARENGEDFELAALAEEPTNRTSAVSGGALEEITDGFEILPAAENPFPQEGEPALELKLPESDLVSAPGLDDRDEKEATMQRIVDVPRARAEASALRVEQLGIRLTLDAAQLSMRAQEALAVLAEEGVVVTAQLRFERETDR